MSIICYDGHTIAADKQGTSNNFRTIASKLTKITREEIVENHVTSVTYIIGWCGTQSSGMMMVEWWANGCSPHDFPIVQNDEERWSRLIVVNCLTKEVVMYEQLPIALPVHQIPMAWGSGADFAIGALSMGATARQAVEVACIHCVYCGMGIEEFSVENDG